MRISDRRRASRADSPLPLDARLVDEALEHLGLLDLPACVATLDRWVAASLTASGRPSSGADLLFETLCRIDRAVMERDPRAGLPEEARILVGQKLRACATPEERTAIFRAATRETVATLRGRRRLSGRVERARDFIRENFERRVSLDELAKVAGVTPNYLSHLFTRECGTTIVRFVNRLRVEEAARLLREGERGVVEIAGLVGYRNYRDLHRNFVKREKLAPTTYRERVPRRGPSRSRASISRR